MKEEKIEKLKEEILGKAYELSFAFISKEDIRILNKKYRGKNKPTDVLSFPLFPDSGEILICKEYAKEKFKKFRSALPSYLLLATDYLLFLTIHGLLHLKGLDHGAEMEKLEQKYFKKFAKI